MAINLNYLRSMTDDPRTQIYQSLVQQEAEQAAAIQIAEDRMSEAIEAVVSRWREWWAPPSGSARKLEISSRLNLKFRLCFPLAAHSLNHVSNSWTLCQSLPWIALSGARLAFEHALTAQWVLLTEDGETALKAQMDRASFVRREKYVNGVRRVFGQPDAAADAHGLADNDLVALIGERPSGGRANFKTTMPSIRGREHGGLVLRHLPQPV